MKNQAFYLTALIALIFGSCKDIAKINADEAGAVITAYLQANQEYKTTRFNFGELKFNSEKERAQLEDYRQLANEGYVSMSLVEAKKKFLSKDSSYTFLIKLTEKASPFVLKQDADHATVKVLTYELASEKPVDFNRVNDNNAKVTVSLKKVNTPFAAFQKEKKDNSEFLTRTYRLKLNKEEGWKVVK